MAQIPPVIVKFDKETLDAINRLIVALDKNTEIHLSEKAGYNSDDNEQIARDIKELLPNATP